MRLGRVLVAWALAWLAWGAPAWAQGGTSLALEAARMDVLAQRRGEAEAHALLLREFARFLGPDAEGALLLLRKGRPVEMAPPAGGKERSPVRVAAPRHPLDWSDIGLALLLARARLARRGIAGPSPQELRAAFLGGKAPGAGREVWVGILTARGSGNPWEEIGRGLGEDPAWLEGVLRAWNERLAAGASPVGDAKGREPEPVRITETGITTGRGKAIPAYTPPPGGGKGIGEGILSGSGNILGVPGHKPVQPEEKKPE
ncbi:MAG: hypothetical protein HYR52_05800 [Candidatus Tectomicrobia bacterium]|uniref:Uncharacterized protein n=1 Tax=Tectimicrobiota bacterium TaxID=2528274 RepID=A0A933E9X3_UNCTE|nr:hypothetical protein [Candidatus Tectomicrobia bacterium]MBI3025015.1 hypothetical protein [Candidatus Tectomicrobia bacterium]MBI4251409.1 hypothetical protein [Candidatus Tectomicrobia bacterium]